MSRSGIAELDPLDTLFLGAVWPRSSADGYEFANALTAWLRLMRGTVHWAGIERFVREVLAASADHDLPVDEGELMLLLAGRLEAAGLDQRKIPRSLLPGTALASARLACGPAPDAHAAGPAAGRRRPRRPAVGGHRDRVAARRHGGRTRFGRGCTCWPVALASMCDMARRCCFPRCTSALVAGEYRGAVAGRRAGGGVGAGAGRGLSADPSHRRAADRAAARPGPGHDAGASVRHPRVQPTRSGPQDRHWHSWPGTELTEPGVRAGLPAGDHPRQQGHPDGP